MKVFGRILPLFLLAISFFGTSRVHAQSDSVRYYPEQFIDRTWDWTIINKNVGLLPINRVTFQILTPGVKWDENFLPISEPPMQGAGWLDTINAARDRVYFWNDQGFSISPHGGRDSILAFTLDTNALDQCTEILWTTYYFRGNSVTQISSGTVCLYTTAWQGYPPIDNVTATGTLLPSCDPSFNLSVTNRNGQQSQIDHLSFEILGGQAMMRPSAVSAPDGWNIDSVTGTKAFFSSLQGVNRGSTQTGFVVTLSSSPLLRVYNIVWRAYNGTSIIDRDTVHDTLTTAPCAATTDASADTIVADKIGGCAYRITAENFHVSMDRPTSPLTRVVLTSQTPGVTFETAENSPNGWATLIDTPARTKVSFLPFSSAYYLPGGRSNSFTLVVDNPSQGDFNLAWSTYDTTAGTASLVSSGVLPLRCSIPPVDSDTVIFAQVAPGGCLFTGTVVNKHQPNPGNDRSVTYSVDPTVASFGSKATSDKHWPVNFGSQNASMQFTAGSGQTIKPFETQTDTFTLIPVVAGSQVPVTWSVRDSASNKITGHGVTVISCTPPPPPCDNIFFTHSKTNDCLDTIAVKYSRLVSEGPINLIRVIPLDGWKVDTTNHPIGWGVTSYGGDSVDFNGEIQPGLTRGGFVVHYRQSSGALLPYRVNVETFNSLGTVHACTGTDNITCTAAGVVPDAPPEMLALTAYPNPFSGQTEVSFTLPGREHVELVLIDVMGRVQQTVATGTMEAGNHSISLNGSALPTGTYYLRLETPYTRVTKKMVIDR
ncbi:MAG: T9SS type A sorting domain-containing protein [Bacteroidota bacterium]|nr:T9SS type A sorting domain-containing protein [Bacteroidota bacterium]MDP4232544.1 T9SS type A sorting domain-containing protein [Bacteroidota bacterium]MDP4243001.1 T9SS type A sorting domain-containing protein [Bacteroidota bacterium]MDP4286424.1 T9SS type A sorting domain-containing protein [Bacteroidota bacterium]